MKTHDFSHHNSPRIVNPGTGEHVKPNAGDFTRPPPEVATASGQPERLNEPHIPPPPTTPAPPAFTVAEELAQLFEALSKIEFPRREPSFRDRLEYIVGQLLAGLPTGSPVVDVVSDALAVLRAIDDAVAVHEKRAFAAAAAFVDPGPTP